MGFPNSSDYSRSIATSTPESLAGPKTALTLIDVVALIVGIVIGAGIFEAPALVAANTGTSFTVLLAWLLAWIAGGIVSLIGALCYAELAATYPITPILFCATCAYLLYSSLVYVKDGAIVGVIVLALGIPVLYWHRR